MVAGSDATHTQVDTATGGTLPTYYYKVGAGLTIPKYGDTATDYSTLTLDTDVEATAGDKILVVQIFKDIITATSVATDVVLGA